MSSKKQTLKQINNIEDLQQDPFNANEGTERGHRIIEYSIRQHGAGRSGLAANDGTLIAGNQTFQKMAELGFKIKPVHTNGDEWVVVIRDDIEPGSEDAKLLALEDNRASEVGLRWKATVLADVAEHLNVDHLFYDEELARTLVAAADAILQDDEPDDEDEPPTESTTSAEQDNEAPPDILFFSDNDWGIPTLDSNLQAEYVVVPVERWGRMARHGTTMPGTWHFYTEDYKFNNLWSNQNILRETGCVNAIEPNISTNEQMPKAVALWGVYRKRWIARFWQSQGIRIFVDLNVDRAFTEINLLGVPQGWRSYATRGYDNDIALLEYDYQIALQHANRDDILFVVLGGGKRIQAMCKERAWHWIPQENHVTEGRQVAYGQG